MIIIFFFYIGNGRCCEGSDGRKVGVSLHHFRSSSWLATLSSDFVPCCLYDTNRQGDVAAIDVNMGCPKPFSVQGGMGAALLKTPEKVKEILTALVQNVLIPVTCKIRVLPDLEKTIELVKIIEATGVAAIGVHGRFQSQRSSEPAHYDRIKHVAEVVKIPVIAKLD